MQKGHVSGSCVSAWALDVDFKNEPCLQSWVSWDAQLQDFTPSGAVMQMLWLCGDERIRCRPFKSGIRAKISAAEKAMTARHLKYRRFFILKTHPV
jgi:hypothetical protein